MAKIVKSKKVCVADTLMSFHYGDELMMSGGRALAQNVRTTANRIFGIGVFSVAVQKDRNTVLVKKVTDGKPLRTTEARPY